MQRKSLLLQISQLSKLHCRFNQSSFYSYEKTQNIPLFSDQNDDPMYSDVPKPRTDKSERKPYPTPMKELIRRVKQEKELRKAQPCRLLEHPPDNGLLVPELVDVAHRVHRARQVLLSGLSKLVRVIPVQRCRFCFEVHIGNVGHEIRTCTGPKSGSRRATHVWRKGGVGDVVFFPKCFHLSDRVGKPRVVHDEQHSVPRIPAVLELCIQAGVDVEKYPSKRRTKPVYSIEGRIVDFESVVGTDETESNLFSGKLVSSEVGELARDSNLELNDEETNLIELSTKTSDSCFETESNLFTGNLVGSEAGELARDSNLELNDEEMNLTELSTKTLDSWFEMVGGAKKIMEKYSVWTCGFCPEVQVGPRGHKVRMCKASKHQSRNGMHAWQEATIDDLVGPNYVWHVRDLNGPPLHNDLKRYYGKAPALVELCVQAGAPVPDQYRSMMRLDVVPPERDEFDLVA